MTESSAVLSPSITQEAILEIANQAFVYGFPLVVMDITREQFTNYPEPCPQGAPINQFSNKQSFPTPADTTVVRPNCDTYYSIAFIDLLREPMVLSIPTTAEQYYMMPLLDAFSNVIEGSPGKRTGDIKAGNYLLVGPNGNTPRDIDTSQFTTVINSLTNLVWALGRFQIDDTSMDDMTNNDAGKVTALQGQLAITPLSDWGTNYSPPVGRPSQIIDTGSANTIVGDMDIKDFFNRLNELLITNPPTAADQPAMESFAAIGVGTEWTVPFNEFKFEDATMQAMELIPPAMIETFTNEGNSSAGAEPWTVNLDPEMGDYGIDYQKRAVIACIGFGANLIQDAVYYNTSQDADLTPLNCDNGQQYTLTFDVFPPVRGFWSLTMYDKSGALYDNAISRYVVGHSTSNPLVREKGQTIIYIQNEPIAEDDARFNNWLPAPAEPFTLLLRAYWPTDGENGPIINEKWKPQGVVTVN